MNSIIVTVTNLGKNYFYDIELPLNVTADRLQRDIAEALGGYKPEVFSKDADIRLFSNRLGREIPGKETLDSMGIWNGDYITLIEV